MIRIWVLLTLAAFGLFGVAGSAFSQSAPEANVEVSFLESEVVLGVSQNVTTPVQVTAELTCLPAHEPPNAGIMIHGYSGVSLSNASGYIYQSEPKPKEIMFVESDSDTYVIDEVIDLRFWSTVPTESEQNFTVYYGTHGYRSGDSCSPLGWRTTMAEATSIQLRLLPTTEEFETQKSGFPGVIFSVIVCVAIAYASHISRRRER